MSAERIKKFRAIRKLVNKRTLYDNVLSDMNYNDNGDKLNSEINFNCSFNSENNNQFNINSEKSDDNSLLDNDSVNENIESETVLESEVITCNEIQTDSANDSDNDSIYETEEISGSRDKLQEKLRQWAVDNLSSLQLNVISSLLVILREEGHSTLPKTAQTLLQTKRHQVVESISSLKETESGYKYLGVAYGLKKIISSKIFLDDTIQILIHIDGLQIYKNSKMQAWPISIKVFSTIYMTHPFVAAIYCGDSKPANVKEYLLDFVKECKKLIKRGLVIDQKNYSFKIIAIVADSQARSYIKRCKPAGTFYACERCTTKGISVGEKKKKKRVYPEMDCELRTKDSFNNQFQEEHHKDDLKSPLSKIPDFDPVNSVVLDSMHLLYLGVMKTLMEFWILRSSVARLKIKKVNKLKSKFLKLTGSVPYEFQRKKFDLSDLARWKATQFRFVLLYCGPVVLKKVMSRKFYKHFLLLFVAIRILNSNDLMIKFNSYAKKLLRHFFYLLPSLYGKQSQTLNMHNLIHIADDVLNLNLSLSDLSAFWGESYIGKMKKLIKSPYKPLTQILNRLSELEHEKEIKIKKIKTVQKCVIDDSTIFVYLENTYYSVSSVSLNQKYLSSQRPDNIVLLKNNNVIIIDKIITKNNISQGIPKISEIYILGRKMLNVGNLFDYPTASSDIGIFVGESLSESSEMHSAEFIKNKCILFYCNSKMCAMSLLHE